MSQDQNTYIITLPAKVLGGSDAVNFSEHIRELVSKGTSKVTVDLSAVELMNSSGLGMLVAGHSTMKRAGGTLAFTHVPENVKGLLRMTHLDSVFLIEDDNNSQQQS